MAADAASARSAIGAGTSSFSGAYADLTGKPTLGGAAALNVGTTTGTVAAGDDARLSDERVPTAAGLSGKTHGASNKTAPVDADELPLVDSAASWGLAKLTWASVKATLKTYFDTLYQAASANLSAWAALATSAKQDALVSGTNIKTVNGSSLLGSGDIAVSASPGGVSGQVQINDGGVFGADAGLAYDKTTKSLTVGGGAVTASAPALYVTQEWNNASQVFVAHEINVTDTASASKTNQNYISYIARWRTGATTLAGVSTRGLMAQKICGYFGMSWRTHLSVNYFGSLDQPHISTSREGAFSWTSAYGDAASGAPDTGFHRNAAGVVEINNGTKGGFSDLILRSVRFGSTYTVATLPTASAVDGGVFYVTDLSALTNGSTPSGGGSLKGLVKSNGTSYVVLG